MSVSTVTNSAVVVTPEATARFVDASNRLTMGQAPILAQLVQTIRPDWDRRAILRQMQITALYSPLEAHEVMAFFINAAATDQRFEDIDFPGVDPLQKRDN